MKKVVNIIILLGVIFLFVLLIDFFWIYKYNRPIIVIDKEDSFNNIKYFGIFYDTYLCSDNDRAFILGKKKKYSCPLYNNDFVLGRVLEVDGNNVIVVGISNLGNLKKDIKINVKVLKVDDILKDKYIYGILDKDNYLQDIKVSSNYFELEVTESDNSDKAVKGVINVSSEEEHNLYYYNVDLVKFKLLNGNIYDFSFLVITDSIDIDSLLVDNTYIYDKYKITKCDNEDIYFSLIDDKDLC